jgi:hypothetical protein
VIEKREGADPKVQRQVTVAADEGVAVIRASAVDYDEAFLRAAAIPYNFDSPAFRCVR